MVVCVLLALPTVVLSVGVWRSRKAISAAGRLVSGVWRDGSGGTTVWSQGSRAAAAPRRQTRSGAIASPEDDGDPLGFSWDDFDAGTEFGGAPRGMRETGAQTEDGGHLTELDGLWQQWSSGGALPAVALADVASQGGGFPALRLHSQPQEFLLASSATDPVSPQHISGFSYENRLVYTWSDGIEEGTQWAERPKLHAAGAVQGRLVSTASGTYDNLAPEQAAVAHEGETARCSSRSGDPSLLGTFRTTTSPCKEGYGMVTVLRSNHPAQLARSSRNPSAASVTSAIAALDAALDVA